MSTQLYMKKGEISRFNFLSTLLPRLKFSLLI